MESVWKDQLSNKLWPKQAIQRLLSSLAPSTWLTYNAQFRKFVEFGGNLGLNVLNEIPQNVLVQYLVNVSEQSGRPKAILNTSVAAVQNYCKAKGVNSPIDHDVMQLVNGLVKSGMVEPMKKSLVLPVKPFVALFQKWGDNNCLNVWALRLKAITLLSITLMLRPSDIAPKSVHVNEDLFSSKKFCRSWITFSDQYATVQLFGIKNDYQRDGFSMQIPMALNKVLCPVRTLKDYMVRIQHLLRVDGPVFISLNRPYTALSSAGIGAVLNKAIELVGLHKKGFSVKCFRPTGATVAIEAGIQPDFVQATSRWKSTEVFKKHYVHAKPPQGFTDAVLSSW